MADLGELARLSLLAIEAWTQNINNNLVGANKIAYKTTRITFGAGNARIDRPPAGGLQAVQFADPTMRVIQSTVEFLPGQIVTSTQPTHFAIKDRQNSPGTNFFVLQDPSDPTRLFLSRDGEFHFATNMTAKVRNPDNPTGNNDLIGPFRNVTGDFLVNNYGLLVLGSGNRGYYDPANTNDDTLANDRGNINGADVKLAYGRAALTPNGVPDAGTDIDPGTGATIQHIAPAQFGSLITRDPTMDDPFDAVTGGLRATGLTYVNDTKPPPAGSQAGFAIHNNPLVVNVKNPQNLTFSRFGSTIFDFVIRTATATATFSPTVVLDSSGNVLAGNNTWDFDATGTGARPLNNANATPPPGSKATYPTGYAGQGPFAERLEKSLEQSTSSVTSLIPELTLAQKMFTAVSKLITVYSQNVDTLNNLIR